MVNVCVDPMRSVSISGSDAAATMRRPSSTSRSARVALASKASPASVMTTRRLVRSNSGRPSSSSICRIWCESVDCVMCRRAAARVKLRSSASMTK